MKLDRLGFRVGEWEADVRAYLTSLCASKPVVFGGDLYNVGAPHVKKSAGTTPEECAAFGELLATAGTPPGMSDTFRRVLDTGPHTTPLAW
jgi:exodeoxyribonuclease-3/AP endonuclease-1